MKNTICHNCSARFISTHHARTNHTREHKFRFRVPQFLDVSFTTHLNISDSNKSVHRVWKILVWTANWFFPRNQKVIFVCMETALLQKKTQNNRIHKRPPLGTVTTCIHVHVLCYWMMPHACPADVQVRTQICWICVCLRLQKTGKLSEKETQLRTEVTWKLGAVLDRKVDTQAGNETVCLISRYFSFINVICLLYVSLLAACS